MLMVKVFQKFIVIKIYKTSVQNHYGKHYKTKSNTKKKERKMQILKPVHNSMRL
jgi:hypothetical protein